MSTLISSIQDSSIARNTSFECGGDGVITTASATSDSSLPQSLCRCRCAGEGEDNSDSLFLYLQGMWDKAVQNLEFRSGDRTKAWWFEKLWKLHCETTRFYHTAVHLEEMFRYLSMVLEHGRQQQQPGTTYSIYLGDSDEQGIRLAIFFHDAIYDPRSGSNEHDSAALFHSFVQDLVLMNDLEFVVVELEKKVIQFIMATQKHRVSADHPESLSLFLDLDMAVLGKQRSAYFEYAALVRKEYDFVAHLTYCEKRAQILDSFLSQGPIYGTTLFHQALEDRARSNLREEIILLQNNVIPGESETQN